MSELPHVFEYVLRTLLYFFTILLEPSSVMVHRTFSIDLFLPKQRPLPSFPYCVHMPNFMVPLATKKGHPYNTFQNAHAMPAPSSDLTCRTTEIARSVPRLARPFYIVTVGGVLVIGSRCRCPPCWALHCPPVTWPGPKPTSAVIAVNKPVRSETEF